jgi:pimeloyl-ACP methyl ester carboxylesterase
MPVAYPNAPLADGIRSSFCDNGNGLAMHYLEAGWQEPGRPLVMLLHGFPELAYSWRKIMVPLADSGFHVVAPDQRGYGRTLGWNPDFDGDLASYRVLNLVRDVLGLMHAIGRSKAAAVIGHDFGAMVAAWAALLRPDIFQRCVLMSAPFAGPPALGKANAARNIHADLAALERPRKHYQWYYSTRLANQDMWGAPQGVHDFLRAYFHQKSADWTQNRPCPLKAWTADELAKLPTYYVMDLAETMPETVAHEMPPTAAIANCGWLPEDELAVYAAEYRKNGFQGGLEWYRCRTSGRFNAELEVFAGRTIDVPTMFISGARDWGVHQTPGALAAMQIRACTDFRASHLLEGAGHWVQQEQSAKVAELLGEFLSETRP